MSMASEKVRIEDSINNSYAILTLLFSSLIGHGIHCLYQDPELMREGIQKLEAEIGNLEDGNKLMATRAMSFFKTRYSKK